MVAVLLLLLILLLIWLLLLLLFACLVVWLLVSDVGVVMVLIWFACINFYKHNNNSIINTTTSTKKTRCKNQNKKCTGLYIPKMCFKFEGLCESGASPTNTIFLVSKIAIFSAILATLPNPLRNRSPLWH